MAALSNYKTYQNAGQGLQAAGGATATVLPWVGAGLTAAGLLSQLYGNYRAEQVAEKNYLDQLREYEEQKRMLVEQQRRQEEARALENQYRAKGAADSDRDGRLSRYMGYYRQIGL